MYHMAQELMISQQLSINVIAKTQISSEKQWNVQQN